MQELKVRTRVVAFQRDAHDVGRWPRGGPQRAVRDEHGRQKRHEDGRPVVERLPSTGSVLMLSPNGDAVWMPLHCGSGRPQENDPYFAKISKEKLNKGFLPMESCPQAFGQQEHFHEDFPEDKLHRAPCKVAHNGKAIDQYNHCECIMIERKLRQDVSAKLTKGINDRYRDKHTLDIESRNAQTETIIEALKTLADGQKKAKR